MGDAQRDIVYSCAPPLDRHVIFPGVILGQYLLGVWSLAAGFFHSLQWLQEEVQRGTFLIVPNTGLVLSRHDDSDKYWWGMCVWDLTPSTVSY